MISPKERIAQEREGRAEPKRDIKHKYNTAGKERNVPKEHIEVEVKSEIEETEDYLQNDATKRLETSSIPKLEPSSASTDDASALIARNSSQLDAGQSRAVGSQATGGKKREERRRRSEPRCSKNEGKERGKTRYSRRSASSTRFKLHLSIQTLVSTLSTQSDRASRQTSRTESKLSSVLGLSFPDEPLSSTLGSLRSENRSRASGYEGEEQKRSQKARCCVELKDGRSGTHFRRFEHRIRR